MPTLSDASRRILHGFAGAARSVEPVSLAAVLKGRTLRFRAAPDRVGSGRISKSLLNRAFFRRTGIHFVGKHSSAGLWPHIVQVVNLIPCAHYNICQSANSYRSFAGIDGTL